LHTEHQPGTAATRGQITDCHIEAFSCLGVTYSKSIHFWWRNAQKRLLHFRFKWPWLL